MNNKDWSGNRKSMGVMLGASNHTDKERELNDFYATDPKSLELFYNRFNKDGHEIHFKVWEPACGMGHLSKVLENHRHEVWSTDLIDRGYGEGGINFLDDNNFDDTEGCWEGDIITNPPYKFAEEFVEKGMHRLKKGNRLIMFLKIQFLEGQKRNKLFAKYPPKYVYVNSSRQLCAMNGEFEKYKATALCYCWYVWEKDFTGDTVIRWI